MDKSELPKLKIDVVRVNPLNVTATRESYVELDTIGYHQQVQKKSGKIDSETNDEKD